MGFVDYLQDELDDLREQGLLRESTGVATQGLDYSSNDYLRLAGGAVSRETPSIPTGAGASRLIFGTHEQHLALESELALWVGADSALLFSSGYAANLGALGALGRQGDIFLSDELNHASIIDGCRLSRASVLTYRHCDLDDLAQKLKSAPPSRKLWVLTESYFSMDGDGPDMAALRQLCADADAGLHVDEAHALGVFGSAGGGLCAAAGFTPDVLVGTLGKAVGTHGAFVAGPTVLRNWLWNRARSFVFSTAPSPLLTAQSRMAVAEVIGAVDKRSRLLSACAAFEDALSGAGVELSTRRFGPIFPIRLGTNDAAQGLAERLLSAGFRVQAIRAPTVPTGPARVRITLSSNTTDAQRTELVREIVAYQQTLPNGD